MRTEGWAWPASARKPHYFREGTSLCRRWKWTPMSMTRSDMPNLKTEEFCHQCLKRGATRKRTA